MDQRATYLLQILESIGSPLMSAITHAGSDSDQNDAQSMAALLNKTVEASIELGNIMDINPAEAQDDTLRVALAGLASPLVAGQFQKRGQVPESPDLKKITGALQAVLTFSDNFTPTQETAGRLKNLEARGQIVDSYQTQIQYMQAFIPVIEVIAAFPFGQAEAKLIMDVSDRLVKKSVELREALLPNVGDESVQKRAELAIMNALAQLYAACHRAETDKVLKMNDDARSAVSIDQVWNAFGVRAAMLEALATKMAPGDVPQSTGTASGGGPAVAATQPTEQQAPPAAPPPAEPPAQPPVQQPPAQPPAAPETPPAQDAQPQTDSNPAKAQSNPMAMFAKPKSDGGAPPPQEPPQTPTQTPPAAPTPPPEPTQPPAAPTTPPPAEEPPAQPPPEAPAQDAKGDGEEGGNTGNPMSFFKKNDNDE